MNASDYQNGVQQFEASRRYLLGVIGFTAVNIVLVFLKLGFYFLCAATIPMVLLYNGMGIVSVVIVLVYLACWFFMEKQRWLILVPTVLFLLDCLLFVWIFYLDFVEGNGFDYTLLPDVIFHGFIMYYLGMGTVAWFNIRKGYSDPE